MNVLLAVLISLLLIVVLSIGTYAVASEFVTRATRYAVTLKNKEGAFIGLCVQKRWGRWSFEQVKITPVNPGGEYRAAAPGRLHVPTANILYYQAITEVANVSQ